MTYTQIRREIGKRLGDDDLVKYKGLVSNGLLEAMCQVLVEGKCEPVEYPELYVEDALQMIPSTSGTSAVSYPDKMLKLIDIRAFNDAFTKEITKEEFERMAIEDAFKPTLNEIFWYQDNKFIWIITPTSDDVVIPPIFAVYLKIPDATDWGFSTDLIEGLKYGRNFIYKCINRAANNLASYPMGRPVATPEGA